MQNEKLFKKIKDIVLRKTNDSDDWDPEKVWLKIEKRQNRKLAWLWLSALAACLVLGIGISFIILKTTDNQLSKSSLAGKTPDVLKRERLVKNLPDKSSETINAKLRPSLKVSLRHLIADGDKGRGRHLVQENDSAQEDSSYRVLASSLQVFEPPKDSITRAENEPSGNLFRPEKVLIAEIELPNDRAEEAPSIRRMFETAKKERESRKIRVNLGAHRKKTALWSFVQHSFIENSTHPDSGFLFKRTY
ncbi:hypothetical protein L0657_25970 [Dyadobacter sp. CY345]|uniref:hypothetical protein n=1 Tax=Dyadobacter sp. CY345 TaxID=2909335 RepID=UPI001F445622|nr:hypothetical protein [Dyadobacter sp. CY345]MCF2447428.1 hypothetical protein [Dyadobacter sp. CY345]